MNLQAEINRIQEELMKIKDPEVVAAIKKLLKHREKYNSSEALDLALKRASEDKQAGRTKPHSEIREKYKKWL